MKRKTVSKRWLKLCNKAAAAAKRSAAECYRWSVSAWLERRARLRTKPGVLTPAYDTQTDSHRHDSRHRTYHVALQT